METAHAIVIAGGLTAAAIVVAGWLIATGMRKIDIEIRKAAGVRTVNMLTKRLEEMFLRVIERWFNEDVEAEKRSYGGQEGQH